VQFFADRCTDPQCNNSTILNNFFDSLGTVNLGETHTLNLVWDGSVITYGMDGVIRSFDPKPFAPVVKPPVGHFMDVRTQASVNTTGGHGYVAATFDNVYANNEATVPPGLAPYFTQTVAGDVTSAGVGLRGMGTGTIRRRSCTGPRWGKMGPSRLRR
jgi:hypothetical protein